MIKLKGNEDSWLTFFVNVNGLRTKEQKYKVIETVVSNRIFSSFERNLAVVQAILDGEWEVEEQLYYVKLVDKEFGYLNQNIDDLRLTVSNKNQTSDWKSKFTRAEVKAIDPRYLEFLEEVE